VTPERLPLHADALPELSWARSGTRVAIDRAADDLARFQVYRYCSIAEAVQLLSRGQWAFAHPRTWPDKFERHISRELFDDGGPFARSAAYVKCLTLEFSSNALWKTYAGNGGVVRIGIALQDLVAMFDAARLPATLHVVRVRYLDERRLQRAVTKLKHNPPVATAAQAMRALTLKRAGFAYENELRLCLLLRRQAAPPPVLVLEGIKFARVRSLQFDPYLPAWQAEQLRHLFQRSLGVKARIAQSRFDAEVGGSD
jgi:hypothetical protein